MRFALIFLCACSTAPLPGEGSADLAPAIRAGQRCAVAADCPAASDPQYRATCLPFPDGYCAQPCAHGFGCPDPGMSCRPISPTGSAIVCFRDCSGDGDCRAGYACCPPWGTLGGGSRVCYPAPCP